VENGYDMLKLFCGSRVLDLATPVVMGILNLTPDSFFDGGKFAETRDQVKQVEKMISEGAAIVDIGAVSTRPGAAVVPENDEIERLIPVLKLLCKEFPGCIFSVDTFRPGVARAAVENGAAMINDIYGGRFCTGMPETIASLNVPYVLMHMKGTPGTMQENPVYSDVFAEVNYFFEQQIAHCRQKGIKQVILDPGFGFGKNVDHNFTLLSRLDEFRVHGVPILAGLSRKSMINKVLHTTPAEALNGTTVLNTIALLKGANILRVHDVKEAIETISLVKMLE
jgi:dihydropteroate synthase